MNPGLAIYKRRARRALCMAFAAYVFIAATALGVFSALKGYP